MKIKNIYKMRQVIQYNSCGVSFLLSRATNVYLLYINMYMRFMLRGQTAYFSDSQVSGEVRERKRASYEKRGLVSLES